MTRTLTLDQLREAGVCSDGLMHFAGAFGSALVPITEDNCRRMAGKLNFSFGAQVFLKGRQFDEFMRAAQPAAEQAAAELKASRDRFTADLETLGGMKVDEEPRAGWLTLASQQREARDAPIRRRHEITLAIEFARCFNLDP